MKITKTELKKILKEELLKEFGSEEYGLQTKEFEPVPGLDFDNPKNRWRSHRNNFFIQWLRYCYLSNPKRGLSKVEHKRIFTGGCPSRDRIFGII